MVPKPRILLIVGGGIAAYKSVFLARSLQRRGAAVRVVMTRAAGNFVGAATFSGITGEQPLTDLWKQDVSGERHVALGSWADLVIVAPATMHLLVRASLGLADDAALTTLSCCRAAVLFAPAMHSEMWSRASTQRAVDQLRADGAHFVGPEVGDLASGQRGIGRMSEPNAIVDAAFQLLEQSTGGGSARSLGNGVVSAHAFASLQGRRLLVTAGPTVEDIDPVRFFSNRSSGKMGVALAEVAADRGAEVTLIAGPGTELRQRALYPKLHRISVRSALDMQAAVMSARNTHDAIIMAAAVADYRPQQVLDQKIKKRPEPLVLELVRNPDILAELGADRKGKRPLLIGFALESHPPGSEALREAGQHKRQAKGADLVVANSTDGALGSDDNHALLVDDRQSIDLGAISKRRLAEQILDWLANRLEATDTSR